MLHMKMKKISQDFSSCMKKEINLDDVLTLPWLAALTRVKISNKGKDIKKNDDSFERHDQFIAAVQTCYLSNMFDNYVDAHPEKLDSVSNTTEVVKFVLDMLDSFNIELFFDPSKPELEKKRGDNYKTALEEHNELVTQIVHKNRHLKDIIDQMRNIIWEINTMLSICKYQ